MSSDKQDSSSDSFPRQLPSVGMIRTLILVVALVATACSPSGEAEQDGLLAIVDDLGDVVIVTADGDIVAETTDFAQGTTAFQPVWSGPGHVVYVEQMAASGSLVVAEVGAGEQRRIEFPTPPFYVYPRPGGGASADIVTLRNSITGGLAAEIVADDASVADFFDEQVDRGLMPEQCGRLWLHTHPGDSAEPSWIDEETFARCFGRTDWSVMFIIAEGGQHYARLRFNVGPAGAMEVAVEVDTAAVKDCIMRGLSHAGNCT